MQIEKMLITLLLSLSAATFIKGVPVAEYELEKDIFIRDFLRSPEYSFCIQNIFLPGSLSSSNGDKTREEETNSEESAVQVFQECITQAMAEFAENKDRRELQKRSAIAEEESKPGSSGIPGISNLSVTQQCMQNAIGGQIPGLGGKSKRSPGEEGTNPLSSFSIPFSQSEYQECVQNALNGVPGASNIPGLGSGNKQKRSAIAEEESKPGSSGIPGISNLSVTQQCMQNAIGGQIPGLGGKSKRSPGEEGTNPLSSFSIPFSQSEYQECVQNALNGVPGASNIPGLGSGNKQKRSPDPQNDEGNSLGSSSIPGLSNFSITQQCFQTALSNSIPGKGRSIIISSNSRGIGDFSEIINQDSLRSGFQECFQNVMSGGSGAGSHEDGEKQ